MRKDGEGGTARARRADADLQRARTPRAGAVRSRVRVRPGFPRVGLAAVACGALLMPLAACGGSTGGADGAKASSRSTGKAHRAEERTTDFRRIPGVGDRLQRRIPADSGQVVAVYGEGVDDADATVVLYTKDGATWDETRRWEGHNGKKGWTTDHHEGDKRSPVGVFTLSDAGGVLADPGAKLPYTQAASFQAPRYWPESHWHDFDYVIAIDYNRVKGTSPIDPTRPEGQSKGGSIWLHMDHGSGTSACVSLSESGMEYLLRTLAPDRNPVIVMGDRANLKT